MFKRITSPKPTNVGEVYKIISNVGEWSYTMGKGSRNRDNRVEDIQVTETTAPKLSKKQLIRIQQKKAKQKKIITWVATAAIAVALVAAIIFMSIPATPDLEGSVVAEGAGFEVDNAMFAYLLYDNLYQYSSYLSYYGYDTSLPLKSQTGACALDSSKTWYEYFCSAAISQFNQYIALAAAAKAEGMKLSDDDVKSIDEQFDALEETAYKKGYGSVNKYLSAVYAPGVTAGAVRRVVELEMLAGNYVEKFVDSLSFTDEQMNKYREDNPGSFLKVDLVSYTFSENYVKDATSDQKQAVKDKIKAQAEAFIAENNTDIEAFKNAIYDLVKAAEDAKTSSSATTATSGSATEEDEEKAKEDALKKYITTGALYDKTKAEAAATKAYYEWAYSTERKAGDTYIEEGTSTTAASYTVYMLETPVYYDTYVTQSVRHILFSVDSGLKGTALDKAFEAAKAEAEKVLEEYNKGDKTAEAFGELAKKHTDDSNGADGGLYENVFKGALTDEFEDWMYDEARKVGDVELVKTTYGWHIMYYEGAGDIAWKVTAEAGLQEEEYNAHLEDLIKEYSVTYNYKVMFEIP